VLAIELQEGLISCGDLLLRTHSWSLPEGLGATSMEPISPGSLSRYRKGIDPGTEDREDIASGSGLPRQPPLVAILGRREQSWRLLK